MNLQQTYYQKNRERILANSKENYLLNRKTKIDYSCAYQKKNKAKKKVWAEKYRNLHRKERRKYLELNKDRLNKQANFRAKIRRRRDTNYKLACNLRHRLGMATKGNFKNGSAVKQLGCTIEELKTYLENQFQDGMSWKNWGIKGWHIDHKKPLIKFDLADEEQLKAACHFSNLQPLWAKDNILKGGREIYATL